MTKKTIQVIIALVGISLALFLYQKSVEQGEEREPVKQEVADLVEPAAEPDEKEAAAEEEPEERAKPAEEEKVIVRKMTLPESVPDGGIAYLNFIDLKETYDANIKNTNFIDRFINLKVFDKLRADIEAFNKKSTFAVSIENTLKIIGADLLLSIYFQENSDEPSFLISTDLDDSESYAVKVLDFFIQVAINESANSAITKETYKGYDINHIHDKSANEDIYYIIIDKRAHLSSDLGVMKRVIDISAGDSDNSLSAAPYYVAAKENFRDTNFFNIFIDISVFVNLQEAMKKRYGERENISTAFKGAESYKYIYADAVVSKGIDFAAGIELNGNNSADYIKFLDELHTPPAKSAFLKNIKQSLFWYGSYSGVSISRYYEFLQSESRKMPGNSVGSFETDFKEGTSLSFADDVISQFDNELVYGFNGFDTSTPMFPIPKLFLGFKLHSADGFQSVYDTLNESLEAAIQNQGMSIKYEDHKGYKLSSVPTPFGILPGHSIISDYYLIYSVPSGIKDIIDGIESNEEPFFDRDDQKVLSEYLYNDYHYFSYFDSKSFLQQVPDLFDRYSNIMQGGMTKEKRREFLKKYNEELLPLLETFKVFKKFASTGYYEKKDKRFLFKAHYAMQDID